MEDHQISSLLQDVSVAEVQRDGLGEAYFIVTSEPWTDKFIVGPKGGVFPSASTDIKVTVQENAFMKDTAFNIMVRTVGHNPLRHLWLAAVVVRYV